MISGLGVFYPDKKPTQRIGIIPDVEVRPTIAGIRAGRDEVLEAALRQILEPAASDDRLQLHWIGIDIVAEFLHQPRIELASGMAEELGQGAFAG